VKPSRRIDDDDLITAAPGLLNGPYANSDRIGRTGRIENPRADLFAVGAMLFEMLTAVPPFGGDTMFASQYLAYEALSDGMKKMLDRMTAVHDNRIQSNKVANERNAARASKLRKDNQEDEPEFEHPVVITHPESGRKALFVNIIRTHRFSGMTEEESRPLIKFLCDHATRPEFTCRFRWEKGSVAFWDNRCVMHYALNDYPGFRRYMNRVTVDGTRPVH